MLATNKACPAANAQLPLQAFSHSVAHNLLDALLRFSLPYDDFWSDIAIQLSPLGLSEPRLLDISDLFCRVVSPIFGFWPIPVHPLGTWRLSACPFYLAISDLAEGPWGKYPSHLLRDRHIPQPRGTAGPIIKCKVRSRRVLTSFLGRTKLLVRLRRLDATFAPTGCLVEDPCGFSSSASKSPWCCALGVRRELLETTFLIKATRSGHNSSSLLSRLITKVEVMEGGLSPNGTAAHEPS